MKDPKTNLAECLHTLISKGQCKGLDFSFVDYRKRFSELKLKYGVQFDSIPTPFINKRGKTATCSTYILRTPKRDALKIYTKINNL